MIEDSAFAFQTFRDYRNSGETPGLPTRRVRVITWGLAAVVEKRRIASVSQQVSDLEQVLF